ncbi:hypothetical protein R3P38DRAFT_2784141 [Favolaschia claudopus]|uniref:Uncharacterized protein n=1 Tax=Favolaschia claudopus TaxID=2862362 RepID=A0AAW0B1D8_9AGAR
MSITINGRSPLSLTSVSAPTTTFSAPFLRQLYCNAAPPTWVPITLYTTEHGFFTVVVRPVVGTSAFDLSLGFDWIASMRELLLGSGWILPSRFDLVQFFLPTLAGSSVSSHSSKESARPLSSVGNSAGGAAFVTSAGGAEERAVGAAVSSAGGAEERAVGAAVSSAGGADERAVGAASSSSAGGTDDRAVGVESHGIECVLFQTVEQYQLAILNHLSLEQAYFVMSSLLSFPYDIGILTMCASAIGFESSQYADADEDEFLDRVRSFISRKRQDLVTEFSAQHPTQFFFHQVEYMTLPMLVSFASLHRLSFHKASLEGLRAALIDHMSSGACAVQSHPNHSVACASAFDQLFPANQPVFSSAEESQNAMQTDTHYPWS